MVDVSVVIVNWNAHELLRKCLQAVYATITGLSFEVILVDNGSSDGSVQMVQKEFPQTKVIESSKNRGFAWANNRAIQSSTGRYVLLLNSDAFLTDQAVLELYSFMERYERVGITGGSLFYPDGRPQISHGPLPTLLAEVVSLMGIDKLGQPGGEDEKELSYIQTGQVKGACLMVRRKTLDQIGLLDECFFMFGEETDLCFRAKRAGWLVCHLPSARVIHVEGGSTGHSSTRMVMLYQGKLRYFEKNHGRLARSLLWSSMWLTSLVKILVYSSMEGLRAKKTDKGRYWMSVVRGFAFDSR